MKTWSSQTSWHRFASGTYSEKAAAVVGHTTGELGGQFPVTLVYHIAALRSSPVFQQGREVSTLQHMVFPHQTMPHVQSKASLFS